MDHFNLLIKTFHLIVTTTLVGISIANYFYYWINQTISIMFCFSKRISLRADYFVVLPLIFSSFITGTFSVYAMGLNFSITWIQAAYVLLGLVLLLQFFIIYLKRIEKFGFLLHLNYWLMFICYIIIIHDAIMHRTYLL